MEENTFFMDTMQGLLEAIAIDRGTIETEEVENMPAKTLKAVTPIGAVSEAITS